MAIPCDAPGLLGAVPALHPAHRGWDSDRLTAADVTAQIANRLREPLDESDGGGDGHQPKRLVDGNRRNTLAVPFLAKVFPRSVFVYVHREPAEATALTFAGWEAGTAVTYPEFPEWDGPPWSYPLTPEWRALAGQPLPRICAKQWAMATDILLGDLARVAPDRWCVVDHGALVADPDRELLRIAGFADIDPPPAPAETPWSRDTPKPLDAATLAATEEVARRSRELMADPTVPPVSRPVNPPSHPAPQQRSVLRSVSTSNFSEILAQLGSSLLVSTYQTGKLVAIRGAEGTLNTHFRDFDLPMGIALRDGALAIGTRSQVFEYRNVPAVLPKLKPPGRHDACFVPRRSHYTGDVRVHEVAYAGDELWLVNTRFSCLCTLDADHSFVPRWRPPFISSLAAEDRCHLNGLAVVDDQVRFVSMLGTSDEAGGWRAAKARGGAVMEVGSDEIVAAELSMPHSPRWYRDQLWVLESGEGAIGRVDLDTGQVETVAQLPGFTRGLSFAGPLAFVGLSEVRESATFGGLPLTGRLEERQCGVWVVNIETGRTVAFLRFEELVEEIFAVMLLPGIAFPEVAEHGSETVNLTYVVPDSALSASE